MSTRERQAAKNEDFFRTSNELEEEELRSSWRAAEFICECARGGCVVRLTLTRAEYEHARAKGNRFVLAPGHEDPSVEIVVERYETYVVVEKQGEAGAEARRLDPRAN